MRLSERALRHPYIAPATLKGWRTHMGLTQRALADMLGTTESTVARLERNGGTIDRRWQSHIKLLCVAYESDTAKPIHDVARELQRQLRLTARTSEGSQLLGRLTTWLMDEQALGRQ